MFIYKNKTFYKIIQYSSNIFLWSPQGLNLYSSDYESAAFTDYARGPILCRDDGYCPHYLEFIRFALLLSKLHPSMLCG